MIGILFQVLNLVGVDSGDGVGVALVFPPTSWSSEIDETI